MNYQSKLSPYLRYLFIAFCLFLILPPHFYQQPGHGVDPSWCIAIHLAHKYNLIFGKDFVFTYGPLTIMGTRLPIAVSPFVYLAFDIYFLATVAFALNEILKKQFHYGVVIFIFLAIITNEYEALDIWYFSFFLFFIFSFLKEPHRLSFLVQAALLSLICFYFKVSFGIIALFIFIFLLTYMLIRKKISLRIYVPALLAYLAALWLSSLALHVNMPGYIKGSLHLINDYNDSMFTQLFGRYTILLYAALVAIFIVLCWMLYRLAISLAKRQLLANMDELLILAIVALGIFIAFKGGFVRADGHITIFFKAISLLVAFLYLFASSAKKIAALCCWVVLGISFWAVNAIPGSYEPYRRIINASFMTMNMHEVKDYFTELTNYNKELAHSNQLGSSNNKFRQVIGDHSVDVMPAEASVIYFNGLKYDPRPVIQSYAAYNAYLDSLNYEKYMSPTAPDYILYEAGSIDDRYAFFDDSRCRLAILDRYTLAGEIEGYLVLRKRSHPAGLTPSGKTEVIKARTGEDVPVGKGRSLQYARVLINYNIWGRIKRLFYKPPAIKIVFTLESGETVTYRAIKSILASGVLVNKYVDSKEEFPFLMLSEGALSARVKKIRFESDPVGGGLDNNITIINTYYSFADKPGPERTGDSTVIAKLVNEYDRFKPEAVRRADTMHSSFPNSIEQVKTHFRLMTIAGWAFNDRNSSKTVTLKAVLRSRDSLYELPTTTYDRGDIKAYFNKPDMPNAGYISTVSKVNLPAGEYQLGVLIRDTLTRKEWISYADRKIMIKRPFSMAKVKRNPAGPADRNISYNIESIEDQGDQLLVRGWSFVKDANVRPAGTYLLLQGKETVYRIPADETRRGDVAGSFHDPLLEYSGFQVQVPRDSLPAEMFDVGLEKVYRDGTYCCTVWSDKKLKNTRDTATPAPVDVMPPIADFSGNIESFNDNSSLATINGWAIDRTDNVRNTIISIVLKNKEGLYEVGTQAVPRPDVEQYYKKKLDADNCGFRVRISKASLPKGKYQVGIHVYRKGEAGTVKLTDRYVEKN